MKEGEEPSKHMARSDLHAWWAPAPCKEAGGQICASFAILRKVECPVPQNLPCFWLIKGTNQHGGVESARDADYDAIRGEHPG